MSKLPKIMDSPGFLVQTPKASTGKKEIEFTAERVDHVEATKH